MVFDPLGTDLGGVRGRDLLLVFYMWISVFPATFIEEAVFCPSCALNSFVKNQLAVAT
jgi:hypothetical protein